MLRASVSDLIYSGSCRRAFVWGKKYFVKRPEPALWFGTGVHKGLEAYFEKNRRDGEYAAQALQSWAEGSFRKISSEFDNWERVRESFETELQKAHIMLQNFVTYEKEVQPFFQHVAGTEVKFEVPINQNLLIVGKVDMIVQDENGYIYIVDHKTFSSPPSHELMEIDMQLTAYCYLFWKDQGILPDAVGYNVLYKAFPEPPRVLKNGSLSKAKDQVTTPGMYRAAIAQNGLSVLDYTDYLSYLEGLGWSQYFETAWVPRTQRELEAFEYWTLARAQDIDMILNDPEAWAYPTPSIYNCRFCPYVKACRMKDAGEDYEYVLENTFTTKYLY